jgi:carbon-monoxide dehydrogenase small subunit
MSDTEVEFELTINGTSHTVHCEARTSLGDLLREQFFLTGTHLGCEHGVCGACTVLLDGAPVRSCITLAAGVARRNVTTIEGLQGPVIEVLRDAFTAEHGLQCGFCTPGMLIMAADLLTRHPQPNRENIRGEMSGNLCRCTGYVGIVNAIAQAATKLAAQT